LVEGRLAPFLTRGNGGLGALGTQRAGTGGGEPLGG